MSLLAGSSSWKRPKPFFRLEDGKRYLYIRDGEQQYIKGSYQYSTLNLGWQRRFGKFGFINAQIGTGYEKNLKQSAFSIATNLLYLQLVSDDIYYQQDQISIQLAPRFYYNFKKRIRKGKTANDLSAAYLSIRNQWDINRYDNGWVKNYNLSLLWGTQRRIFEHMFINYEFGYSFPSETYQLYGTFISELKIGIAF